MIGSTTYSKWNEISIHSEVCKNLERCNVIALAKIYTELRFVKSGRVNFLTNLKSEFTVPFFLEFSTLPLYRLWQKGQHQVFDESLLESFLTSYRRGWREKPSEASCVAANFRGILLITTFDLSQLFFWLLPRDRLQKKKRNHRSRSVPGNSKAILGRRNRRLEILGQEILGSAPPPAEISLQCKILDSYLFIQFNLWVFQALSGKYCYAEMNK